MSSTPTPRGGVAPTARRRALEAEQDSNTRPKKQRRCITVGSDCTGLNGARLPFEELGLGTGATSREIFASETCEAARKVLMLNFDLPAGRIHYDVTTRDPRRTPYVDFYSAGFPCQSFSRQGLGEGLDGENGRVGLACLLYVNE